MTTIKNSQFPGKTFRRLEVGEIKQKGDYIESQDCFEWVPCWLCIGEKVTEEDNEYTFYREITTLKPSELLLQTLERVIQKLDAVLAKLND